MPATIPQESRSDLCTSRSTPPHSPLVSQQLGDLRIAVAHRSTNPLKNNIHRSHRRHRDLPTHKLYTWSESSLRTPLFWLQAPLPAHLFTLLPLLSYSSLPSFRRAPLLPSSPAFFLNQHFAHTPPCVGSCSLHVGLVHLFFFFR